MTATAAQHGGTTRMYWEVVIPGEDGAPSATVVVEAENWFSALRAGLSQRGVGGQLISNLTCDIKPDKTVFVTDFVTRKVYTLKPSTGVPATCAPASVEAKAEAASSLPAFSFDDLPPDLPEYLGFQKRDEISTESSGIYFRERLLAVAPGTDREDVVRLATAVFEKLKSMGAEGDCKLYASVQVYDHVFEDRFERPAIVALEWKEWSPKKAKIQFPLSGSEEQRFSYVPGPRSTGEEPIPAVAAPVTYATSPIPLVAAPSPVVVAPAPLAPAPAVVEAPKKRTTGEGAVLDDVFFQVFERMHEIYERRDHDEVAAFALDVAREFIKCEAGSSMLITPGKYELYVAAAQGEVAGALRGKRMSLTAGIVGFSTRAGAVVTVSDPERDPRFHDEFDKLTNFRTRNVLCAPLQFEGKTIGAIELLNTPRPSGFLQSEANVLSYIAGAVAEYIDTSLPSREAEFSDQEFASYLPARRFEAQRSATAKKPDHPSPTKPAPSKPEAKHGAVRGVTPSQAPPAKTADRSRLKTTSPEIPAVKRGSVPPSVGKAKKKKKH
jgi:hypothetical protein